jgi:hypothetical protein
MGNLWAWLILFLIFPALVIYRLRKDYADDAGEHRKAKWVNGILIFLLFYTFMGSISNGVRLLSNFSEVLETTPAIGVIPKWANVLLKVTDAMLSIAILFLISRLIRRNNDARIWLTRLLPLFGVVLGLSNGRDLVLKDGVMDISRGVVLMISLAVCFGVFFGIARVYKSSWMVRFFERIPEAGPENLIYEVGTGKEEQPT